MKFFFSLLIVCVCAVPIYAQTNIFPSSGSAGIGTTTPNSSSVLDMVSTTQGVLVPRMIQSQRNAIVSPASGLLIYQTDHTPGFYYYTGTSWTSFSGGANKALSNLKATAVNLDLIPQDNTVENLGSTTNSWNNLYIHKLNLDNAVFLTTGGAGIEGTFVGSTYNTTNSGYGNTFVGDSAGSKNDTGIFNTFVGFDAGVNNISGGRNCFFGVDAGMSNDTGRKNCFFGCNSGAANIDAFGNAFFGYKSGISNTSGNINTFLGEESGQSNTTGTQNVFVGSGAGNSNISGSSNTCIGYGSGTNLTSGNNNTLLGASVTVNSGAVTNSIGIGYSFKVSQSNIIQIGSSSVTKIGIGINPASGDVLDFNVTTAKLTTGGVWTNASDRKLKDNFQDLDSKDILNKVNQLPIQRWHYIAEDPSITHIGPVAQDFYRLFHVGDDTTISTVDPAGIALLAIQSLSKENREKDSLIAAQQNEINQLKVNMQQLQQSVSQLLNTQDASAALQRNTDGLASLSQNVPNPFSDNSVVSCYVPSGAKNAMLVISALDGKQLQTYPLSNFQNEINIRGGSLPAGEYIYSLQIDGKTADSKRMILTK